MHHQMSQYQANSLSTHHKRHVVPPIPPRVPTPSIADDVAIHMTTETHGISPNIQLSCTPADLVAFFHTALFSPTTSTLLHAMKKGFLLPFAGLTESKLERYPPPAKATAMGHMDSKRKYIQSIPQEDDLSDSFPDHAEDSTRSNYCFLATAEPRNIVYSDQSQGHQTGRLPHPSAGGNNYLMIANDYDSNAILMRPIKNRTADVLTDAIKNIHETLSKAGCQPKYHRLDNECPAQVKAYFAKRGIQYQMTPQDDHRSNTAERAIRTTKNHLAAGWYSTDDNFPMYLWDKTIPQAELTVNLLRGSRINPKLSAWEQLHE
jgi:hypothetical protein